MENKGKSKQPYNFWLKNPREMKLNRNFSKFAFLATVAAIFYGNDLPARVALLPTEVVFVNNRAIVNCTQTERKFLYSEDGMNWETVQSDLLYPIKNLTYFSGAFYGIRTSSLIEKELNLTINDLGLVYSSDLKHWNRINTYSPEEIKDPWNSRISIPGQKGFVPSQLAANDTHIYVTDRHEVHRSHDGIVWEFVYMGKNWVDSLTTINGCVTAFFSFDRSTESIAFGEEDYCTRELDIHESKFKMLSDVFQNFGYLKFRPLNTGRFTIFPTSESNYRKGQSYSSLLFATKDGINIYEIGYNTDDINFLPLSAASEDDELFIFGWKRNLLRCKIIKYRVDFQEQTLDPVSENSFTYTSSNWGISPMVFSFHDKLIFFLGNKVYYLTDESTIKEGHIK